MKKILCLSILLCCYASFHCLAQDIVKISTRKFQRLAHPRYQYIFDFESRKRQQELHDFRLFNKGLGIALTAIDLAVANERGRMPKKFTIERIPKLLARFRLRNKSSYTLNAVRIE